MTEAEPDPFPQVIVLSGAHKGDVFVVDSPFPVVFGQTVGIKLPEPALGPAHCQIFQTGERWFIMDLGSETGTWLGDERVEGVRPLEFGRTFRIGDTHLAFLLPDPEEPADPDLIHEAEQALRAAVPGAEELELEEMNLESGDHFSLPEELIPEEAPLPGLEDSAEVEPGEMEIFEPGMSTAADGADTGAILIPEIPLESSSSGVVKLGTALHSLESIQAEPALASDESAARLPSALAAESSEQDPASEGGFIARRKKPRDNMSATDILKLELPSALGEDLKAHESFGDYDVIQPLGRGSLGPVYKCYDRRRRRVVSLKLLDSELGRKKQWVTRFLRGAKAGSRLQHRYIVATLGAGHAGGRVYIVNEYVEGLDLEQFCVARGGRLEPRIALQIFARVTEALVYAHGRRVIHRAVSPSNILIGPGGVPKLSDLAFAKRVKKPRDLRMSGQLYVEASSPYTPPEALLGGGQVDARADIYGVGACLFRCLSGWAPYGDAAGELVARLVRGEREPWGPIDEHLSPELKALVERCLAADPTERYPASRDLRDAIADLPEIEER
ncbi:MAG: protein kinase [Planctomycetes bacterium]|nr:protein kinase [Planctomycetota bacterium]